MPPKPSYQTQPKHDRFLPRCRCTEEQRQRIEKKAADAGLSLSEYQRRTLLEGVIITPPALVNKELINELIHQGTNLNQYVKKLNGLGKDSPQGVERTRLKIESLLDTLMT